MGDGAAKMLTGNRFCLVGLKLGLLCAIMILYKK